MSRKRVDPVLAELREVVDRVVERCTDDGARFHALQAKAALTAIEEAPQRERVALHRRASLGVERALELQAEADKLAAKAARAAAFDAYAEPTGDTI